MLPSALSVDLSGRSLTRIRDWTAAELDAVLEKAKAYQARDDRVDIIDRETTDHGMLAITSIYVGYLLPMMVEIQYWDYK